MPDFPTQGVSYFPTETWNPKPETLIFMVRIRLARGGVKKKPYYRVVVADQRCKRDGRYLERIGFYNPMVTENRFEIDAERVKYWISKGAQPTDRVSKLMKQAKIKA